jgi:3-oxoacyl-[acyl-carrier protein] reductase
LKKETQNCTLLRECGKNDFLFFYERENMFNLKNKVAIITGGSRGIGAATVRLFASAGCNIVFTYRNASKEAKVVESEGKKAGIHCFGIKSDISILQDVEKVVAFTLKKFKKIDILVNNAGIWTYGEMGKFDMKVWEETIKVNIDGSFYMINAVTPIMKRQKSGKIINLASTAGQRGEAYHSHYAASKGAIISLTKSLASELGPFNINVNSVAPGWVDTDMSAESLRNPKLIDEIREAIPIKRVATAEDIAGPILFLASDLARHINGEILNVNGGSVLVG